MVWCKCKSLWTREWLHLLKVHSCYAQVLFHQEIDRSITPPLHNNRVEFGKTCKIGTAQYLSLTNPHFFCQGNTFRRSPILSNTPGRTDCLQDMRRFWRQMAFRLLPSIAPWHCQGWTSRWNLMRSCSAWQLGVVVVVSWIWVAILNSRRESERQKKGTSRAAEAALQRILAPTADSNDSIVNLRFMGCSRRCQCQRRRFKIS